MVTTSSTRLQVESSIASSISSLSASFCSAAAGSPTAKRSRTSIEAVRWFIPRSRIFAVELSPSASSQHPLLAAPGRVGAELSRVGTEGRSHTGFSVDCLSEASRSTCLDSMSCTPATSPCRPPRPHESGGLPDIADCRFISALASAPPCVGPSWARGLISSSRDGKIRPSYLAGHRNLWIKRPNPSRRRSIRLRRSRLQLSAGFRSSGRSRSEAARHPR